MLPCIAATIATVVGTKNFESNVSESNELLLANVEALAEDETVSNQNKCGTKETYENGYSCPGHSHRIGFKGTIYSYSAIGFSEKYKKGRKGTEYSCPDLNQPFTTIDDVKDYNCPTK